ncbi:MAG: hypothetical protein JNJ57_04005 [Saprospiraceae bacterium]|nr:hypothetical protein [Saprospiraceae bacterium]
MSGMILSMSQAYGQGQPVAASSTVQKLPGLTAASGTTRKVADDALLFTFALSPEKSELSTDTLPDADFRMYNPARRQVVDYGTIGNLGGAARPMLFQIAPQTGLELGLHAFDLYALHAGDLRFYRHKRAFSEAFFSQGKNNLETQLDARFSRTFGDGINFSLEYRAINNLGQYDYQRNRHNALTAGLWIPIGNRYDAFFIFYKNVFRQRENGGIVTDSVFSGDQFEGPLAASVRLPEERAYTRVDDQGLNYTHHFRFAGGQGQRSLRATHVFEWSEIKYKFSDGDTIEGLGNDASFFGNFLVNERGIRHFGALNTYSNKLTINTFRAKKPGEPSDLIALGIMHNFQRLNQEPQFYRYANLFLTGDVSFTPSKRFAIQANAALGVLQNLGEYRIGGNLFLSMGKAGVFKATLLSQRRPPDILFQRLFVSKIKLWDLDLEKPVETTLSASYGLPLIGFEATARTSLVNNYLYYDQDGFAAQTSSPLQVVQLLVKQNLKFGWVHFDNTVALQQANRSDVFRLPSWFTKNSLYISGRLFKKRLLLTTGFDFRMNSEFLPDGYQPVTGQFYLQDSLLQKPYPWVDAFLAFKVQDFRFFFRYENAMTLFDKTKVWYQTAYHPQPFGALRLGVSWRFLDDNIETISDTKKPPSTAPNFGQPAGGPVKGGKF